MNYLILAKPDKSEFYYQALDYYRLLDGFIEPSIADGEMDYIKNPKIMPPIKARGFTILAFRHLLSDEIKSIHDDNRIVCFINDDLHPGIAVTGNLYDCFIAFGHRTAYRAANYLKAININRPVYKIAPWVDATGIKQYEKPPFGKVAGNKDISLRPMFRLMASGAIPVVPDISPFTDFIINKWNGIVYRSDPDFAKIGSEIEGSSVAIAARAKELSTVLLNRNSYIVALEDTLNGKAFDHNEPWISVSLTKANEWIIIKETIENGAITRIPQSNSDRFKMMKPLTLEQLLNMFSTMRFERVYVFDAIIEEITEDSIGRINRLITMLGERLKDIIFCFDQPKEWKILLPRLAFIAPSEAEKQVI